MPLTFGRAAAGQPGPLERGRIEPGVRLPANVRGPGPDPRGITTPATVQVFGLAAGTARDPEKAAPGLPIEHRRPGVSGV